MLRINEIKLPLDGDEKQLLAAAAARELRIKPEQIRSLHIRKKAVDARRKDNIRLTYCVDVEVAAEVEKRILKKCRSRKVTAAKQKEYRLPLPGSKSNYRPVVVGMGPAGLLCGLVLAEAGLRPILLERGECVENRRRTVEEFWASGRLNPGSNVQFGQGGAGAFSDGKLNTNTKDKRNRKVLQEFVAAGAPEEILYLAKPHIGTDLLLGVVQRLGEKITSLGGELRFNSKVKDLLMTGGKVSGVVVETTADDNGCAETYQLASDDIVLAIGHSARDTFQMLYDSRVPMAAKPFSVGARVEHLQQDIDRSQYGGFADHGSLGAADYKLSCHLPSGRSVYTFCMCPGGVVVNASSEEGAVVTNGMSRHARAESNANAAVLVGVTPEDFSGDHPLAGVEFQRKIEQAAFQASGGKYAALCQRVDDFLADRPTVGIGKVQPSFLPQVKLCKIDDCLPDFVTAAMREGLKIFGQKLAAFADGEAVLTAPETRSSSPVRILRGEDFRSECGVYPCGEGAGYAGGIMSAAADGIRVAEAIIKRY